MNTAADIRQCNHICRLLEDEMVTILGKSGSRRRGQQIVIFFLHQHKDFNLNKTQETLVKRPPDCVPDNFGPYFGTLFGTPKDPFEPIWTH